MKLCSDLMLLILDGNSEHFAHVKIQFVTALDLINDLNRSNNRDFSLNMHLILGYCLISVPL